MVENVSFETQKLFSIFKIMPHNEDFLSWMIGLYLKNWNGTPLHQIQAFICVYILLYLQNWNWVPLPEIQAYIYVYFYCICKIETGCPLPEIQAFMYILLANV